ncbi:MULTISPECIES: UvrD-helicase domain-containing protein [unclassified Mesorhizobium]|uniref:UvrD-helicase domain-containing protein n=1 Tax=unclassified Mesorhizobium TaxID=325217 RepID=UPI001FF02AA6|nr:MULTISPECIES: UvrD-helicase domain-containing protein [unclassified Mesorhizobium]
MSSSSAPGWEGQRSRVGRAAIHPEAWRALRQAGCVCVVAGPGAGKTEFLAQRAVYLLETGACPSPYQVLAISFKSDAADNLAGVCGGVRPSWRAASSRTPLTPSLRAWSTASPPPSVLGLVGFLSVAERIFGLRVCGHRRLRA